MKRGLAAVGGVILACGNASARPPGVTVSTIQLPDDRTVRSVFSADADGDGADDLIVVAIGGGKRTLRLHLRRDGDALFDSEPDFDPIVLPANVTACAVGDVHPRPGPELILFTVDKVAAVWFTPGAGERRGAALLTTDLLWQLPHRRRVVVWQAGLVDIDGDGRDDLLIPRPDGYHIALQDGETFREHVLQLPAAPPDDLLRRKTAPVEDDMDEEEIAIQLGLGEKDARADLLRVNDKVPSPHAADWDADGDLDLVAQTRRELLVWIQEPRGVFPTSPTHVLDLPVRIDWPGLDVSYRTHLTDLNGDQRADYVLVANDRLADDTRAQVLPYRQAAGAASIFDTRGRPLFVSGFVPQSEIYDVDGDGRPDLVLAGFRPEDMRRERDANVLVYRNDGDGFAATPMLKTEVPMDATGSARFLVDLTGDSVRDLVVRDEPDRIRVLPVTRDRNGALSVRDREIWTWAIDEDARIRYLDADRGELLVYGNSQVMHVRLR